MKRFSVHFLNEEIRLYTLKELSSNCPGDVTGVVLDLLPVGETVWNGTGTKITRLPDEDPGVYVAIGPKGVRTLASRNGSLSTVLSIDGWALSVSADRILFIAEDGSVKLVKDRYGTNNSNLLPAFPK